VGDCVPFYFCPRSVMLYLIYQGNHPDLQYHGGQDLVLHLEADLYRSELPPIWWTTRYVVMHPASKGLHALEGCDS